MLWLLQVSTLFMIMNHVLTIVTVDMWEHDEVPCRCCVEMETWWMFFAKTNHKHCTGCWPQVACCCMWLRGMAMNRSFGVCAGLEPMRTTLGSKGSFGQGEASGVQVCKNCMNSGCWNYMKLYEVDSFFSNSNSLYNLYSPVAFPSMDDPSSWILSGGGSHISSLWGLRM